MIKYGKFLMVVIVLAFAFGCTADWSGITKISKNDGSVIECSKSGMLTDTLFNNILRVICYQRDGTQIDVPVDVIKEIVLSNESGH